MPSQADDHSLPEFDSDGITAWKGSDREACKGPRSRISFVADSAKRDSEFRLSLSSLTDLGH
jgi:hypothetical protein